MYTNSGCKEAVMGRLHGQPGPGHLRHMAFTELYSQVITHLRLRSNLTDQKVRDLAAKYKYDARMVRDTPEGAKEFLKS